MSYYGSVEDIKCKIGVTIWFELWSYDTIMTGKMYIENGYVTGRAGKLVVGNGPKGIGLGQLAVTATLLRKCCTQTFI